MSGKLDERFMRAALSEARKGIGLTSPNPAVGAVLVVSKRIIARGYHRGVGLAHAEIACLRQVRPSIASRGTLYVTLEPCSTSGRTPPCINEIIQAKVGTVVIGAIDPNPRHSGRGIQLLRDAGIHVRDGILANECASINEGFNKWIVSGVPFVIAKCAMTLDGKLTRPAGEPRWISRAQSRKQVHQLRAQVDAIIVGAETIRKDNPHLTVRGLGVTRQPMRVVLTRSGKLPRNAHVFSDRYAARTIVYRRKSLQRVLRELGKLGITSVLIEGGSAILSQALEQRIIDKLHIYLAPMITGGPVNAFAGRGAAATTDALHLQLLRYQKIEQDVSVTGYLG